MWSACVGRELPCSMGGVSFWQTENAVTQNQTVSSQCVKGCSSLLTGSDSFVSSGSAFQDQVHQDAGEDSGLWSSGVVQVGGSPTPLGPPCCSTTAVLCQRCREQSQGCAGCSAADSCSRWVEVLWWLFCAAEWGEKGLCREQLGNDPRSVLLQCCVGAMDALGDTETIENSK